MAMKKLFFLLSILLSMVGAKALAYDIEIDGFYYNVISPTTLEVTSGDKKYEGYITIPEKVIYNSKTYDVVSVGENAFEACDKLVSIVMGSNITKIGDRAFYGCSSLVSYSFNTSNIGSYVFAFCTSITGASINMSSIPAGMFYGCSSLSSFSINASHIGPYAFAKCTALTGDVRLSCSIGKGSFSGCTGITSVTLNALTPIYIDVDAFANCTSLKSLKLVSKFENGYIYDIGKGFGLCPNLEEVNVNDYQYSELYDGAIYSNSKKSLKFVIPKQSTVFVVPSSVQTISSYAFSTAGSLRRIVLGSSNISLTKGALLNCPDLKELYCYSRTPSNIEFYIPPEVINDGWFHRELFGKLKVYVPSGCKSYYEEEWPWSDFIIDEFDVVNFDPYSDVSEGDALQGDANGDNIINNDDIEEVMNYITGSPSEKFNQKAADANGDGTVNVADIVTIVNIIRGN